MSKRGVAMGLATVLSLAVGCAQQAPAPSPPPATTQVPATTAASPARQESQPTASDAFTMPKPQDDALARATMSEGQSASMVLDRAASGVSYFVRGACDGGPAARISYVLLVEETEVSSGTWPCGQEFIDSGFSTKAGDVVQISFTGFQPASGAFSGFVEVVPDPT